MNNRTTVVQDGPFYYIVLQMYTLGHWTTLQRLSHPYDSYEEAVGNYHRLQQLGYMDPSLYESTYAS